MDDIEEFDSFEMKQTVNGIIEKVIGDEKLFEPKRVKTMADSIVQQVLHELSNMKKPFKFIVTCTINQRDGAGLFSYSSCWFNADTDAIKTFRWENDAAFCVVSLYIMSLH